MKIIDMMYTIFIVLFAIILVCYALSVNPSTEEIWNDGTCRRCDQRFVVVKARGAFNWYVCQECGQEVKRFTW